MRPDPSSPLQTGGLVLHSYLGRQLHIGFLGQSVTIAGLSGALIVIAAGLDHTLVLSGRNVGLLQHPTIWTFLGLQIALPLSMRHSLTRLLQSRRRIREISKSEGAFSREIVKPLEKFLRLGDSNSKAIAAVLYCIGLTAFVWNTYQNQRPGVLVPFDFWDSINHFWGFWITRVYKLYLFAWLLPYVALIHLGILTVVLKFVRKHRRDGKLQLIPFHPDGVGGLGFVPPLVTTPIIVTLLMCSASLAAAIVVHRALVFTPLMGFIIIFSSAALAYIVPIVFLRSDIVVLKRNLVNKLMLLQQAYYSSIAQSPNVDFESLRKGNEALDYFGKVRARVEAISNYPNLKHLVRFTGLAITPSAITIVLSLYDHVASIVTILSKKP